MCGAIPPLPKKAQEQLYLHITHLNPGFLFIISMVDMQELLKFSHYIFGSYVHRYKTSYQLRRMGTKRCKGILVYMRMVMAVSHKPPGTIQPYHDLYRRNSQDQPGFGSSVLRPRYYAKQPALV